MANTRFEPPDILRSDLDRDMLIEEFRNMAAYIMTLPQFRDTPQLPPQGHPDEPSPCLRALAKLAQFM